MKNEEIVKILSDDKIPLEDRFWMATVLVDTLKPLNLISKAEELNFYGPFKQAIFGKCTDPAPGLLDMINLPLYLKWKNWNEQDDMSTEEAQEKYMGIAFDVFERIKTNDKVIEAFGTFTEESLHKKSGEKKASFAAEVKKKNEQRKAAEQAASTASKEQPKGMLSAFQNTIQNLVYGQQTKLPSQDKPAAGNGNAEVSELALEDNKGKASGVKV